VHFLKYAVFQYIFNVFKNVILLNRHKSRVTCIFHIEKLLIFNTRCYNIVHPHLFIWRALWSNNSYVEVSCANKQSETLHSIS